jgi:transcriptional regulator with XRE-family HTH domain
MSTHLSRFFRQRREARKLSFGDLGRRLGYINVTKGANKVIKFERDGNIQPDLFRKVAAVLEISDDDIRRCVEADRAEWERWADEPIEPHLVARIMCAVYSTKRIPPEL